MNQQVIQAIVKEAKEAAHKASETFFHEVLGGKDRFSCGFAWTNIYSYQGKKIDGRSRLGKEMKAAGVGRDWQGIFQVWNPSGFTCQNVDTLEKGAVAAAEVFKKHGFEAYAGSRLD